MIQPRQIVSLFCVTVLSACGGGDGGGDVSPAPNLTAPNLAAVNITDARSLYIAPGSTSKTAKVSAESTANNRLFKVTDTGYVEEVTYTDESGAEFTTTNTPSDIFEAGPAYLVIGFDDSSGYLVRKSDGRVFAIDGNYPLDWMGQGGERFINRSPFRTDNEGNVYYPTVSSTTSTETINSVYKIDVSDPSNLVRSRVTPETDNVWQFAVSGDGRVAYYGSPQSRVANPSGELFNLPSTSQMVWTTPTGSLHFFGFVNNNWTEISQITVGSEGTLSSTKYGDLPEGSNGFAMTYFVHEVNGNLYRVEKNGGSSSSLVVEFFNDTAQPRFIPGLPVVSAKASGASDTHLFIAGTSNLGEPLLIKVDPQTDSYTDVLTPNTYDVFALSVSGDGYVNFSATRMSDSAKVIGQIDNFGNLQILDATLSSDVSVLVPVN